MQRREVLIGAAAAVIGVVLEPDFINPPITQSSENKNFTVILVPGRSGGGESWLDPTKSYLESIDIPTIITPIRACIVPSRGEYLYALDSTVQKISGPKKVVTFSASGPLALFYFDQTGAPDVEIIGISNRNPYNLKGVPDDLKDFYVPLYDPKRVRDNVADLSFFYGGREDPIMIEQTTSLAKLFGRTALMYRDADHGGIVSDLAKMDYLIRNF